MFDEVDAVPSRSAADQQHQEEVRALRLEPAPLVQAAHVAQRKHLDAQLRQARVVEGNLPNGGYFRRHRSSLAPMGRELGTAEILVDGAVCR